MLLWGYVLMTRNPLRTKTFQNVSISFESGSEADLMMRKLTVYGDVAKILEPVSVTVSAPLTDISKMNAKNITATVNLNDVPSSGTYTLEIKAVSTVGTVVSVEPATVTLEVDDIVSRTVSLSYGFRGELPEGYWNDTPTLDISTTTLEGARSDIERVSKAICYIDLANLTESIDASMLPTILDVGGEEINRSVFKSIIPSVQVKMTVLPHKHVPISYDIADIDQIPDIFEIQSISLNYSSLDIAAPADQLAELVELTSDPVFLGSVTNPESKTLPLTLYGIPENAYVLSGADPGNIQLSVVIVDKQVEQQIDDVPIRFVGELDSLSYEYAFDTVSVIISGPARLIREIMSSDFVIAVNVEGRGVGEYDLMLEYSIADTERFADINIELLAKTVHVSVKKAPVSQ